MRKIMIKVKDLIAISCSTITIMDGAFEVLFINVNRIDISYLSEKLLDHEIDTIDTKDCSVRVWLKEDKND